MYAPYPENMMESIKKVEATRAQRMATEPRRLTADEKDALLKKFHPDYNPDAFADVYKRQACVERCPRDVKPGKLIDAARQLVVRQKGQNYLTPDEIPELLDPELPQQLLVSAFRRYRR